MSRRGVFSLFVVTALAFFVDAQTVKALSVRVDRQAVTASGVTAGGSAVFFAVMDDVSSGVPMHLRKAVIVSDADGDGTVRLEMPQGVPLIGIWAVVDISTGAFQLATRPGYGLSLLDDAVEASFKRDDRGHIARLERQIGYAELLVVRPGQGAWTISATEGGENDSDSTLNANLVLRFAKLTSLMPDGSVPADLVAGDVVVLIDAGAMSAYAARFTEQSQRNPQ